MFCVGGFASHILHSMKLFMRTEECDTSNARTFFLFYFSIFCLFFCWIQCIYNWICCNKITFTAFTYQFYYHHNYSFCIFSLFTIFCRSNPFNVPLYSEWNFKWNNSTVIFQYTSKIPFQYSMLVKFYWFYVWNEIKFIMRILCAIALTQL